MKLKISNILFSQQIFVLGTVLAIGNTVVNQTDTPSKFVPSWSLYSSLAGETINHLNKIYCILDGMKTGRLECNRECGLGSRNSLKCKQEGLKIITK